MGGCLQQYLAESLASTHTIPDFLILKDHKAVEGFVNNTTRCVCVHVLKQPVLHLKPLYGSMDLVMSTEWSASVIM